MIISDNGHTFYIVPKKFVQGLLSVNTCWNDMAGLVTVKEENLTEEEVIGLLNSVALMSEEFELLTERIVNKFGSKYVLEINK